MVSLQVKYNCKILPLGNFATIAIVLSIGMAIMFSTIFLGLHPIVSTVLMVGIMFVLMSFFSSEATFLLTENGLTRTLLSQNFLFRNQIEKYYDWKDVKAYKNGTDKGRYRGEFQYVEIKFKNGDEWKIADMYGVRKETYDVFIHHFLAQVNKYNETRRQVSVSNPSTDFATNSTTTFTEIKREKTFYESVFGKIFTIAVGVFIIFLLTKGLPFLTPSAKYKIIVILIPGFLYMLYRTFLKQIK